MNFIPPFLRRRSAVHLTRRQDLLTSALAEQVEVLAILEYYQFKADMLAARIARLQKENNNGQV